MHPLNQTLENYRTQLNRAEHFLLCHAAKLPEGVGMLTITDGGVAFSVTLRYVSDDDQQRLLQLLGEVFGRSGWIAKLSYDRAHYDWSKKDPEGIILNIWEAQKCDQPPSFPVPPNAFPILLGNASEACSNVQDSGQNASGACQNSDAVADV